jgi:dihydroorotase
MEPFYIKTRTVFPEGIRPSIIGIDPEKGIIISVEDVAEPIVGNQLLFPGFIDAHVHAREYPAPPASDSASFAKWGLACRKEVFATAGNAAINGGVTLIAAMPNDLAPPDNSAQYSAKMQLTESSPCPVILFASISRASEPWADLPFKVYLDTGKSNLSFDNWPDLEETLGRYKGCRVFFHAEDPDVLRQFPATSPRWKNRPPEAEISAVRKILDITAKFSLKTHICHISTEKAVLLVQDYNRTSELKVTSEATPHHLFFSIADQKVVSAGGKDVPKGDLLECNPPLRTEQDRLFLLDALKNGIVDILASDHAPHTMEDKKNGAPGMPHLDTLGPFAGWLMSECDFSPEKIAEILSYKPGRLFAPNLDIPQATIAAGFAASFTVLEMGQECVVDQNGIRSRGSFRTRCAWSPFTGFSFPVSVSSTIVRGREYRF